MSNYHVISEREAWDTILYNRGNFVPWIGAGVSKESDIPCAQEICEQIAQDVLIGRSTEQEINGFPRELTEEQEAKIKNEELGWNKPSERYAISIERRYPSEAQRVDFFRKLVARREPSFGHHATALLIQHGILSHECITTNFDKLLERAFSEIGVIECQPIRTAAELPFLRHSEDKAFCIKIHGDYDTHNLMNTRRETVIYDKSMLEILRKILRYKGAIVIGSGGFEKSIHTLFDKLALEDSNEDQVLHYGLLWGVYIEDDSVNPEEEVRSQIAAGSVSEHIVQLIGGNVRPGRRFAFFPLKGGAGEFARRLIQYSRNEVLIRSAEPYFGHKMRIKAIFRKHNLSHNAAKQHIKSLDEARKQLENAVPLAGPDWAFEKKEELSNGQFVVWLCYGSLADTVLLAKGRESCSRAAILSPDDTFISVGGGTALAIANAAGYRHMVHDVSKLAPIKLGDVAVTTAGKLPVEYVLHGASIEIAAEERPKPSPENIRKTMVAALEQCVALKINALFVPLLATGLGRISPIVSISEIFEAISEFDRFGQDYTDALGKIRIIVVVFRERDLPRLEFKRQFDLSLSRKPKQGPARLAAAANG